MPVIQLISEDSAQNNTLDEDAYFYSQSFK